MRAGLSHRLVGVGGPEHPGRQWDGRAGQAPGIARAVEPLAHMPAMAPSGASASD